MLLDAYAGEDIPDAVASEAFFRDVAARLAPGGVVAINIAEPEGSGAARPRAPSPPCSTPFECRHTAVDGNVMLFAAAGPRAAIRPRCSAGSPTGMRAA